MRRRLCPHLSQQQRPSAQRSLPARAQWKEKPLEGKIAFQSRSSSAPNAALTGQLQKVSLDALTGIAYLDDSQIGTLTIARAYDKRYPRITIDITPA
jgi:hypothetical protein